MKKVVSLICITFALSASAAFAACPSSAPNASNVNYHSGDQRVSASWLKKNLAGKKVHFSGGTEVYGKDGSYAYQAGGKTYKAPGYRFYETGMRCIDYANNKRYDFYVVNNGKLVLINADGGRYEVTKIR